MKEESRRDGIAHCGPRKTPMYRKRPNRAPASRLITPLCGRLEGRNETLGVEPAEASVAGIQLPGGHSAQEYKKMQGGRDAVLCGERSICVAGAYANKISVVTLRAKCHPISQRRCAFNERRPRSPPARWTGLLGG